MHAPKRFVFVQPAIKIPYIKSQSTLFLERTFLNRKLCYDLHKESKYIIFFVFVFKLNYLLTIYSHLVNFLIILDFLSQDFQPIFLISHFFYFPSPFNSRLYGISNLNFKTIFIKFLLFTFFSSNYLIFNFFCLFLYFSFFLYLVFDCSIIINIYNL